jgi:hypothetical protein
MKIDLNQVKTIGSGLLRPEGVMVLDDGTVMTADGGAHAPPLRGTAAPPFSAPSSP